MKYNYPANYLTKDGKIKKAYAKKAAETTPALSLI